MHCFPFCNARRPLPLHTWQIPVPLQWEHFRYASSMAHPPNDDLDEGTVSEIPEIPVPLNCRISAHRNFGDCPLILSLGLAMRTVEGTPVPLPESLNPGLASPALTSFSLTHF